ncbi:MAG: peptidoglycan editing factor PgeF [Clostridia bacterium]|nr:peptidoglycan editing factor PgeF [Clostridia bacterium]
MFKPIRAENGVIYYASDMLGGAVHGFSTRIGGVSSLPHTKSLNLAFGRGDEDGEVLHNVRRLADALGFDADALVSVPQIHSDIIIEVGADMRGAGVFKQTELAGDGYIITEPCTFAAIKTADCVPVLMFDPQRKICAAVHAGWRGTFSLIARGAVEKMVSLGCKTCDIRAAIGPAIGGKCYEVGEDVYVAARAASPILADAVFTAREEKGKYLCNLKMANRIILETAGVPAKNIDVCELCTHCETELFYSHRASGGVRGTMMSVIGMV